MRKYLNHKIKVGDIYYSGAFGKTEVVKQIDENTFEVKPLHKPNRFQFGHPYYVNSLGRFGHCYNNPRSLCYEV